MFGIKIPKALIWSVISSALLLFACSEEVGDVPAGHVLRGETQGTTYSIILSESGAEINKIEIDSVLHEFDLSLSTYIDNSVISKLNNSTGSFSISDRSHFFKDCYQISQHIYKLTDGEFDPSVFPLVKGWGFMNNMKSPLGQKSVDSLLNFVSFSDSLYHTLRFEDDEIQLIKFHDNF